MAGQLVSFGPEGLGAVTPMRMATQGSVANVLGRPTGLGLVAIAQRVAIDNYLLAAIGYGLCVLYLRSDLDVTLNGGDVSAIGDRSGSGNDLSQGTGANQPLYTAGLYNGKPAIQFTSANSDVLFRASCNLVEDGPYTVVLCIRERVANNNTAFFSNETAIGSAGIILGTVNGTRNRNLNHSNVSTHIDSAMQTTAPEIWVARMDSTVVTLDIDGANVAVGNSGAPAVIDPGGAARAAVGASNSAGAFAAFSDIDFMEVAVYRTRFPDYLARRATRHMGARYKIAA